MDNPFIPDYFSYRNEYPIEEIWNMDNALAQLIVPRLQDFKDMREWNNAIQKMINAFDLMKYVHNLSEGEQKTVDKGMRLFCKYFRFLWD